MIVDILSDYKPHPGQMRIHKSRARFKNLLAGRRFGKDYAGARDFISTIYRNDYPKIAHLKMPIQKYIKYQKPLLHYWAVAPDFNIGKIQQREIFSIFPSEFQQDKSNFDYDDNRKELRIHGGRILIEFKSADRPETLVGVGLRGVYCTEFARFKDTAWSANIRPTLTDYRGWGIFTSTPLPKPWYLEFVGLGDKENPKYHPDHINLIGKTVENIRIEGIAEEVAVARATMPEKFFLREYEASLDAFEGQVYDEWSEKIHCPTPFRRPEKFDEVIAGVDWGYSVAGVILVVGVEYRHPFPRFWVLEESYDKGILIDGDDDSWCKRAVLLQAKYGISKFYCDTSEPGYIQAFRNKGLNALYAEKDINAGIQSVAMSMHVKPGNNLPDLFVDKENAPNLCREVVMYNYIRPEIPTDLDNHSPDALRYVIHTYLVKGGIKNFLIADYGYSRV